MKSKLLVAFLLGVVVALASVLVANMAEPDPVQAQTVQDGGGFILTSSGVYENQARDMIWILTPGLPSDAQAGNPGPRLLCYEINNDNLRLRMARNIFFDMQLDEFRPRRHDPSVSDVREEILQSQEEREGQ